MKKNILVIFPYDHLVYSPTTMNLCRALLEQGHNVTVLYGFEKNWQGKENPWMPGHVKYNRIEIPYWTIRIIRPLGKLFKKLGAKFTIKERLIQQEIEHEIIDTWEYDEIIAVDLFALYCVQQLGYECHFVSLEADDSRDLLSHVDSNNIKSVITQSKERLERLFKDNPPKHFFVPNAPTYHPFRPKTSAVKSLVYNGTIQPCFGGLSLVEFAKKYRDFDVTFKGFYAKGTADQMAAAIYKEENVHIDKTYESEIDLQTYLTDFGIGVCLYDFDDPIIKNNLFNYKTAPSGKVNMYLSAGLPVIATRIPSLQFLEDEYAGVLVLSHVPETIKQAVDEILANYETYSYNARILAQKNSFKEKIKPFLHFIEKEKVDAK